MEEDVAPMTRFLGNIRHGSTRMGRHSTTGRAATTRSSTTVKMPHKRVGLYAAALSAALCACMVRAKSAARDESDAEDPMAAYQNYVGYLNNLVPILGAGLLFFIYFGGAWDPEKNIKGPKVRVSHILVKDEADADTIYQQVKNAKNKKARFADLAAKKSTCPSKSKAGQMGVFGKGQMMPEFEAVAFTEPVGSVHKVHTKFGWHVLMITSRDENDAKKKQ